MLQVGDKAPDFNSINENGEAVSLSQFKGKKLVLYFYPKDDTPGCTAEACSLRDSYHRFQSEGYEILGVSPDSPKKHLAFIKKYELPFSLLSDENKEVLQSFGAWGRKKFMGKEYDGVLRSTFVIDAEGMIQEVIAKVDTAKHAQQLLKD